MCDDQKYKVVDGSGDALVIQVTNNEATQVIHVCVVSYQADGSIVVLHPPKNVSTANYLLGEHPWQLKLSPLTSSLNK